MVSLFRPTQYKDHFLLVLRVILMILNIFILHAFNIARNMACKNPLESMLRRGTLYAKKSCDQKNGSLC